MQHRIDPGAGQPPGNPRPIRSVGVIGAGLMGRSIAVINVEHNIPVTITDASADALSEGIAAIHAEASDDADVASISSSTSTAELNAADLVIEAVTENLKAKRKVLAQLEPHLCDDAIVASNTSSIPINQIVGGLTHPERVCGMHFCHPVQDRRLVEVIPGRQTSDETVATAVGYVRAIGKLPLVVKDRPGFLINRLLLPYMNEAVELLLEGASMEAVETVARAFGMPMGPLTQLDTFGIDVAVRTGTKLHLAYPDRVPASELLVTLYRTGRLGRKTGAGFFSYKDNTADVVPNPDVAEMIRTRLRDRNVFTPKQLTQRMFLPMLVEATRALEEGVVRSAREVDMGLEHGLRFLPRQGGLFLWADSLGAAKIVELLKPLEPLGKRYEPTKMLHELAEQGGKFYDGSPSSDEDRAAA